MTENERFTWKTVHGWQTPAFLEVMNGLDKKNQQLKEENEQLKQAYQTLKHRHSLLHDVCIEAECDRDSLKKDVISLEKENDKLKNALKNSYLNEICENCKHGYYYLYDNQGFEGDFECKKGHDGTDCDGLKYCDDFELEY